MPDELQRIYEIISEAVAQGYIPMTEGNELSSWLENHIQEEE